MKITSGGQDGGAVSCETCRTKLSRWVITPVITFVSFLFFFTCMSCTVHTPRALHGQTRGRGQFKDTEPRSPVQGWPVLSCWKLHLHSRCLVLSLPAEWRPLCPQPPLVYSHPRRCLFRWFGLRWILPWVRWLAALLASSPILWRWSRLVCSFRESCVPGAPIRNTTGAPCRLCGSWAARTGCGACRRASQWGWCTRAWWTVSGWDPTPTVKPWVSPPSTGEVCCRGQEPEPWGL